MGLLEFVEQVSYHLIPRVSKLLGFGRTSNISTEEHDFNEPARRIAAHHDTSNEQPRQAECVAPLLSSRRTKSSKSTAENP